MSTPIHCDASKRHDFVLLYGVSDGNPNGDPDADNLPRVDPETMEGLVTDVAIKRRVRDWVDMYHGTETRRKIYVQNSGVALNAKHRTAYTALGIKPTGTKQKREDVMKVRAWMCENFYDIRTFGAVMTTEVNCGQVRGPVQLTLARSISPIIQIDHSITRVAVTKEKDAEFIETEKGMKGKTTEMGRKPLIPYGLYRGFGFVSPHFAKDTGFTDDDLALFWEALERGINDDHSASRGRPAVHGLYIFTHENPRGNAPAHRLFERIHVVPRPGVQAPRAFTDYVVTIDDAALPQDVMLTRLVDESRLPSPASAGQRAF